LTRQFMNGKRILHEHVGFSWQREDNSTPSWVPQGITGLRRDDKRYVVISWYGSKAYRKKGVRVSLVDVSGARRIKYRHVLLVQPAASGSRYSLFEPIKVHAGGLASRRNMIFAADTKRGVRVFDANRLFRAQPDRSRTRCGIVDGKAYAFDYRYILPQAGMYELKGPPRFSFASMDWSEESAPSLLMGNYHRPPRYDNPPPTLSWWKLDGTRIVEGLRQVTHDRWRVQGAVAHGDHIWLSCSGRTPRLLESKEPFAEFTTYDWPTGCEDLHYSPYSGNMWCLTEPRNNRFVFAVRRRDYESIV
jgi:hypothetical protein